MKEKTSPQLVVLKEFEYSGTLVFAGISPLGEMIAIRQVCENLGIDRKWQQEKLKSDPYFGSVGGMEKVMAKDGKYYPTYCLPAMDVHAWLWNLKPTPNMNLNVWESYKNGLVKHILTMLKVSLDKIQEMKSDNDVLKHVQNLTVEIRDMDSQILRIKKTLTEVEKKKAELVAIREDLLLRGQTSITY